MKIIHKYAIGDLVLRYNARSEQVLGMIRAYEDHYYLVDWYGWVPPHHTGIISEVEIERWREMFLREAGLKPESSTRPVSR